MSLRLISYLFFFVTASFFTACSDDNDYVDRQEEVNKVKVVVYSNSPETPVLVEGFPLAGNPLIIKGYWERETMTKSYGARVVAQCEDRSVLITIKIYVRDKLFSKIDGNSYVSTSAEIKKDSRKY